MIARMQVADAAGNVSQDFSRYCLLSGCSVQIEAGNERISGQCLGIDSDGALLVQTTSGQKRLHAGTVTAWS
jgi:biotin-(acetyl-CoA carboxylase) ligase